MSDFSDSAVTASSTTSSYLTTSSDIANIWLLPDGVVDLFSTEAQKQEMLRYQLTQMLVQRGYELICPPMIEYTESLLNNASEDLKRQTFKIIDQATGRLMGVRADITPQILRIDAHLSRQKGAHHIARYCYAGHVIHTMPSGLFGSRTPLQLGAEIFGCEGIQADIELIDVLFGLLEKIQLKAKLHVDIGQVGVFKRLCELADLQEEQIQQLMRLYANKALPELAHVCKHLPMGADFYALASQGHDMVVLKQALSTTAIQDSMIAEAMDEIATLKQHLEANWQCHVSVDVTELSGYHYHTGLVFNVYLNNESQPVARGGRFEGMDNEMSIIAEQVQSIRPATGFSLDLTRLQSHIDLPNASLVVVDYSNWQTASSEDKKSLQQKVDSLRNSGYRVIQPLSVEDVPDDASQKLVLQAGEWCLQAL
ncbi:ATP phosphoribosyltransferase regulatory subunit [Psychrobacter sp. I-STPA6b]|uniref:ATP phosphoribosyltransferase regulatory subunit n=1 Tax=Psychrobacter sp. I-STPA6b TaxID=2585718 RepID=UPI001D0CB246|nr:ATP phosphoribosyltransferase regulatory subunit [Psychrobacter sp. I-STPA6b]